MSEELPKPPQLEHRERKRFGAGCFAGAFGVLSFLYLLSPPFVESWLSREGPVGEDFVWVVYAPIRFAVETFEFVEEFYEWYFSLFPDTWGPI